jgi:hypothetical protein
VNLHPDFGAFIDALVHQNVEFVIVGSFALAMHGRPRATGDIDFWIRPTAENAKALIRAVDEFGFGFMKITEDDIVSGKIIQMGVPPVRIDLITILDGLSAEDIWSGKVAGALGGRKVFFLGKDAYARNKRAVGRPKDLGDLELLGDL